MADNVNITDAGANIVPVSSDEIAGGVQVQVVKIGLGADGVIDTLLDSGQQLAANSVPVVLPATQITTLTPPAAITGFATAAKQDTLLTELQAKADLTETQPVSLATLPTLANVTTLGTITNVVHVDDNGGALTVDGTVTANTGLTQPLTDTQLRASAVPVSVASLPSQAVTNAGTFKVQEDGAALTALQLIDNMISGSEAQVDVITMPVTHVIADSGTITAVTGITNAVTIQDGGNTITVDGTVTANTGLSQPLTDTQLRDSAIQVTGAVSAAAAIYSINLGDSGEVAADATYGLDVDVTRLPAAPANDGVDIGDVDVKSLPVDGDGVTARIVLRGYNVDTSTWEDVQLVAPGSYASVPVSVQNAISFSGNMLDQSGGVLDYNSGNPIATKFAAISAASSGNNTIVSAVADKKIRVLSLVLSASASVNAKFQSGASGTDLTGLYYLAANGGVVLPTNQHGWFETAASALLNLNLSAANAVGGCLTYIEV